MKIEDLKIGDQVRYETYFGGVRLNAFGIIDSELNKDYYCIKNLVTHKPECRHHKNSIIAKVVETGENYREIRIETTIRRFSLDDMELPTFSLGDACNHCAKCGTSSQMGEYYIQNYLCKKCRDKCCKCGEYSVFQDKLGNYFCENHIPTKYIATSKSSYFKGIDLATEIKDRLNYFYKKTDETMNFPNSAEGDILKMVNKLLNE